MSIPLVSREDGKDRMGSSGKFSFVSVGINQNATGIPELLRWTGTGVDVRSIW
jgi:hypothetical protein